MFRYVPIQENLYSDDLGCYISFGIECIDSEEQTVLFLSDVSVNRDFIEKLCFEFTAFQLSPIHLYDVIQDKL